MHVWLSHIARVRINRVRLPILLVVSRTGKMFFPCPRPRLKNLISRDKFGSPVPRQSAHLHTQAEYGAFFRDSSRVPRRRPFYRWLNILVSYVFYPIVYGNVCCSIWENGTAQKKGKFIFGVREHTECCPRSVLTTHRDREFIVAPEGQAWEHSDRSRLQKKSGSGSTESIAKKARVLKRRYKRWRTSPDRSRLQNKSGPCRDE